MKKYIKLILTMIISFLTIQNIYSDDSTKAFYYGIMEEFEIPASYSYPDTLIVDSSDNDLIWFTQPAQNSIGSFHYKTKEFKQYQCSDQRSTPDGLDMDSEGNLWFGNYHGGTLGYFNISEKRHYTYEMPYEDALPAHAYVDGSDNIWITDHVANAISMFNKKTKKFKVYKLPDPTRWVVEVDEDSSGNIWYTGYYESLIGRLDPNTGEIKEYKVDASPAFLEIDKQNNIWVTDWVGDGIHVFDIASEKWIYNFKLSDIDNGKLPGCGGIAIDENSNNVIFSELVTDRVVVLDYMYKIMYRFDLITKFAGQKDGIIVDNNGVIWFLETVANKIGRLEIKKIIANKDANLVIGIPNDPI